MNLSLIWFCIAGCPFSLWMVIGRFALRLRFCLKILLHNFVLIGLLAWNSQSVLRLLLLGIALQVVQQLDPAIICFLRMISIVRFVLRRIQAVQSLALSALHYLCLEVSELRVAPFD
jgi:hypothetical protein